jgi:ribosomal protein L16 Arg81 hydroxylase
LFCQVVGSKYIRLYHPNESEKLYPKSDLLSNTSEITKIDNVDEEKFPLFDSAKYVECILKEGEMLFLPKNYWHYVESLELSFSVSFWFS